MNKVVFRCEALERALTSLKEGLETPGLEDNILLRDGVIQRFEYCFELAWKLLQRALVLLDQEEMKVPICTMPKSPNVCLRLPRISCPRA